MHSTNKQKRNQSQVKDNFEEQAEIRATESTGGRRFSDGKVGQRPPSRRRERPLSSHSLDSPFPLKEVLQQRNHRPLSYASSDQKIQPVYSLQRQNSVDNAGFGSEYYENFHHGELLPRPPRPPTSGGCPRSAKSRVRPLSRTGREQLTNQVDIDIHNKKEPFPPPLKPQLSFSKYKPLPSIGTEQSIIPDRQILSHNPTVISTADTDQSFSQSTSNLSLRNDFPLELPKEPSETELGRLHLAVKLPNGSRHERWFRQTDTLGMVLLFAETLGDVRLPPCKFFTNEMPRHVFDNLSATLTEAGISSKTVLYLEEVDDLE